MAFVAFAEYPVDVGVIEAGMGGQWDATNVLSSLVSVMTPIGFDHYLITYWLTFNTNSLCKRL